MEGTEFYYLFQFDLKDIVEFGVIVSDQQEVGFKVYLELRFNKCLKYLEDKIIYLFYKLGYLLKKIVINKIFGNNFWQLGSGNFVSEQQQFIDRVIFFNR